MMLVEKPRQRLQSCGLRSGAGHSEKGDCRFLLILFEP
jgi:hypothetical protein